MSTWTLRVWSWYNIPPNPILIFKAPIAKNTGARRTSTNLELRNLHPEPYIRNLEAEPPRPSKIPELRNIPPNNYRIPNMI